MFQLPLGLALALVTAPGPRPAAADWGASWVTVEAAARAVKQVRASFVQRKSMKILVSPLISRGAFRYRAGGAIVWEYTAPLRSRLVLKGGRAVRYLWQQGRFVVDANASAGAMQVVLGEIKLWMRGRFRASRAFGARLRPGSPSRIVLTPRKPAISRYIRRIELTLGQRRGTIQTVTIFEQAQAVTRIQLTTTQVTYR
jgi:hypothetical protein